MRRTSFEEMNCSVAQCLEVVGDWWSLLIVRDAFFGVRRFDDFQARLGISRNILNQRLTTLVDKGVLDRVPYQEQPAAVGVPADRQGSRPLARRHRDAPVGRPVGRPRRLPLEMRHRSCGHVTRRCPCARTAVSARPSLGGRRGRDLARRRADFTPAPVLEPPPRPA